MFEGIIIETGTVKKRSTKNSKQDVRVFIKSNLSDLKIGDSVSCAGICLTVINLVDGGFEVDMSQETIHRTAQWNIDTQINLEPALKFNGKLNGHLITGHVDDKITVKAITQIQGSHEMYFQVPDNLMKFIAIKGSVALDGVSLTVNDITDNMFSVNIIPHTYKVTTFHNLTIDSQLNIEVDIIARYVHRMYSMKSI